MIGLFGEGFAHGADFGGVKIGFYFELGLFPKMTIKQSDTLPEILLIAVFVKCISQSKTPLILLLTVLTIMVRLAGIEPTTPWFVAKYSIQLSYSREVADCSMVFCRPRTSKSVDGKTQSRFSNINISGYKESIPKQKLRNSMRNRAPP